jgi:hypothetical protein
MWVANVKSAPLTETIGRERLPLLFRAGEFNAL